MVDYHIQSQIFFKTFLLNIAVYFLGKLAVTVKLNFDFIL